MADDLTQPARQDTAPALVPVRRPWCVYLATGLVLLGALMNIVYLFNHCPLQLTEDESHYWEWSRHLDYGYYSKPPGIAWVIWLTLRLGGALGLTGDGSGAALMPVMRLAAVFFGLCSGLLSLRLARRIFRDDRAALAVIVLSAAVPMFAVGSLLITIDSPMYLCWSLTVYALWRAAERPGPGWLYLAGLLAAVGMLFKPVLIALPLCALVAAYIDPRLRRAYLSRHAAGALGVMLCSLLPTIAWNASNGWVTFRHILTQGGLGQQAGASAAKSLVQKALLDPLSRLGEYVGGQAGGMGGILFVLLVLSVWAAIQKVRTTPAADAASPDPGARTRWTFLLCFSVPLWGFYFLMNLWKGTEVNWPAASYFAGMILLAGIFVEGWNAGDDRHRRTWRTWGSLAVGIGIVATGLAMNTHRFYPLAAEHLKPLAGTPAYLKSKWNPRNWEKPIADKLRGMQERADAVEKIRQDLKRQTGQDPLLIATRYDNASSLSFYLPDHPFVFCIMSSVGGRQNQYDLWPGLGQKNPDGTLRFAGRPAVILGDVDEKTLRGVMTFDDFGKPETLEIPYDGVTIRQVRVYRALGFQEWKGVKGGAF